MASHEITYTLRDRLGSVVTLSNHNNLILEHRSYDPFGKPRYGTMQASPSATLWNIAGGTPFTMRGFTDHEHIDEAQLIHMNGRVYDYNLGRFLSVDPFILEPGNSQSLNPYSYIMNNPLAGTDPSGYVASASAWINCRAHMSACASVLSGGGATKSQLNSAVSSNGKDTDSETAKYKPADPENIKGPQTTSTIERKINAPAPKTTSGGTTTSPDSDQQQTTDKRFKKNHRLDITIADGKIMISGTVYTVREVDFGRLMNALDEEFSGNFMVDGQSYTFNFKLKYTISERVSDISLTTVRGLPPKDGGSFHRSNAQQGGKNIEWSIYEKNAQHDVAHELMHIIGFDDTYYENETGAESTPFRGHENDIMGSPTGIIQDYHIRTILKNYGN